MLSPGLMGSADQPRPTHVAVGGDVCETVCDNAQHGPSPHANPKIGQLYLGRARRRAPPAPGRGN